MSAIHILLRQSIDYAGLFPPAGLDMASAAGNYAQYLGGESAWALGRFILPASRLGEFESAAEDLLLRTGGARPWRLSGLTGPDLAADLELIDEFNRRHGAAAAGAAIVDTVEVRAGSVADVEDTIRRVPRQLQTYLEIPAGRDPHEIVAAIGRLGGRAKVRTGGVTRDAFPATADLIRVIATSIQARVPFKATAGLHHPLRAEYRLTYAADSARGIMFGFLNLFLAAAFIREGMPEVVAAEILEETSAAALQVTEQAITWRGHRLDAEALRRAREDTIVSFGSCSFTEPIEELQSLQLLEPRAQPA
jgi:hypothetical protein